MNHQATKISFILYFLALGIVSAIWQMIFLRESLNIFRGNELSLNYFLIAWLTFTGLGSLIKLKRFNKISPAVFFTFYYLITALLALTIFLLINYWPRLLNFTSEIPPWSSWLLLLPLSLVPLGLMLGFGFAAGAKYFQQAADNHQPSLVNLAYLLEILGFSLGSLAFNFWLVKILAPQLILISLLFALLISLLYYCLILKKRKLIWSTVWLGLFCLTIYLVLFGSNFLNSKISSWHFPGQTLVKTVNTYYGQIVVSKKQEQFNFFLQGSVVVADNYQTNEELVHLPLALAQKPSKVLIIGSGGIEMISQALKYPDLEIYYLEPDPEFLPQIRNYLSADKQAVLASQRLKVIQTEPLQYLKQTPLLLDSILINLPALTTYQINRFYTQEFFSLVRSKLTQAGIFSFSLPYPETDIGNQRQLQLVKSIYQPLQEVFTNTDLITGQKLIFLASPSALKNFPEEVTDNFKASQISTAFVSALHFEFLLTNERNQQLKEQLNQTKTFTNANWQPLGLILQIIKQSEISQPAIARTLNQLLTYRLIILALALFLPIIFISFIYRQAKDQWPENKLKLLAILASSLSLILEIIIIFAWQNYFGYIYRQISLIIGVIMLGLFLANLQLYLKLPTSLVKTLKIFLLSLLFYTILALYLIFNLANYQTDPGQLILLTLALIGGYLSGAIYPLTNWLYLKQKPATDEAGEIYGLELVGGAILLMVFSLLLLPFFGLVVSLVFLCYWLMVSLVVIEMR